MKKVIFLSIFILALIYLTGSFDSFYDNTTSENKPKVVGKKNESSSETRFIASTSNKVQVFLKSAKTRSADSSDQTQKRTGAAGIGAALHLKIEDGLAVVHGDIIVGALVDQNAGITDQSQVVLPGMKLWPTTEIPYYIEADVPHRERIFQALELFKNTAIRFVAYENQKDGIVFTTGSENCKSYVGYVGNLQPIYLAASCSPADIAHEIMHALGFVHEQNRTDREQSVRVLFENIDELNRDNFEMLPQEFMKISGLSEFDFESLMIYPTWMFAKNGGPTMQSISGQPIRPTEGLSRFDEERINKAYGSL